VTYKAKTPLEKAIGQMVRSQGGPWLSEKQMASAVAVMKKKGITEPGKDSYDDIARVVGKFLSKYRKKVAESVGAIEEEKLTPGSLLAYMKKTGHEVSVGVLASSFSLRPEKVTAMLSKMVKEGKLARARRRRIYVYMLPPQAKAQAEEAESIEEAIKHNLSKMLPWADDPEFGGTNAI